MFAGKYAHERLDALFYFIFLAFFGVDMVQLYRIYRGKVENVPCIVQALSYESCHILPLSVKRQVLVWFGGLLLTPFLSIFLAFVSALSLLAFLFQRPICEA